MTRLDHVIERLRALPEPEQEALAGAIEEMLGRKAVIAMAVAAAVSEADRDGWIDGDDFLEEIETSIAALEAEARLAEASS